MLSPRRRCLLPFCALVAMPLVARPGEAQTPNTIPRATVSGVAHDSVAGKVLAGATVQLVSVAEVAGEVRSDTTGSLGRFTFEPGMSGCGSIVIWTRIRPSSAKR